MGLFSKMLEPQPAPSGGSGTTTCSECNGSGKVVRNSTGGRNLAVGGMVSTRTCPRCNGAGFVDGD
jgi:DnaJ-class molecular chaperone